MATADSLLSDSIVAPDSSLEATGSASDVLGSAPLSRSSDLSDFLKEVSFSSMDSAGATQAIAPLWDSKTAASAGVSLAAGQTFLLDIIFAEVYGGTRMQYATSGPNAGYLVYTLPDVIHYTPVSPDGVITGVSRDGGVTPAAEIGTYTIKGDTILVKFEEKNVYGDPTPGINFIENHTDAVFAIGIMAQADPVQSSAHSVDFGAGICVDVSVGQTTDASGATPASGASTEATGSVSSEVATLTATPGPLAVGPSVTPALPDAGAGAQGFMGIQALDTVLFDSSSSYFSSVIDPLTNYYQNAPATTSYGTLNNAPAYSPTYYQHDWDYGDGKSYVVMHTHLINQIINPNAADINAPSNILASNIVAYCTDVDLSYWEDTALVGSALDSYRPVTQLTPDMQAKIRWIVEHSLGAEGWQQILTDLGLATSSLNMAAAASPTDPFQNFPTTYPNGTANGITMAQAQNDLFNNAEAVIYYATQLAVWEILRGTPGNMSNAAQSYLTNSYFINPYANPAVFPNVRTTITTIINAIISKVGPVNASNYGDAYSYRPQITATADRLSAQVQSGAYVIPVSCTQTNVSDSEDPHVVTIQPGDQVTYTVTSAGNAATFSNGSTTITANYSDPVSLCVPLTYTGPVSISVVVRNSAPGSNGYYSYLTEIGVAPMDSSLTDQFQSLVAAGYLQGNPITSLDFDMEGYLTDATIAGTKIISGITSTEQKFTFALDQISSVGGAVTAANLQQTTVTGAGSFSFTIKDLSPGDHFFYRVHEVAPGGTPDGWIYDQNYYDVEVSVSATGDVTVAYYLNGLTTNPQTALVFKNVFGGPKLPDTGGIGVAPFVALGALIMLLSGTVIVQIQRRRTETEVADERGKSSTGK